MNFKFTYALIFMSLIINLNITNAQQQLGSELVGENIGDEFGYAVAYSADGNILAVGARFNSDNGNHSGHTKVYEWDGTDWVQKGTTIIGDAEGDASGRSVALSANGDVLAIGATSNDGGGDNAGQVKVYVWDETSSDWIQQGDDIYGEAAGDKSGYSVALSSSGNTVAIGARDNDGGGTSAGHVRTYDWIPTAGGWVQVGTDIDGDTADDEAGYSVALARNGFWLAVGARYNDDSGDNAGQVKIYEWSQTAMDWVQIGQDLTGMAAGDQFGVSVAMTKGSDGNRLIAGGRYNDEGGFDAGHARVYDWDGTNWIQVGSSITGEAPGDRFGRAVAVSNNGNRIAIGARYNDVAGNDSGHVRVFDWNGTDWEQSGSNINGSAAGELFGGTIGLSSDGDKLAIGGHNNNSATGQVRVFALTPLVSTHSITSSEIKVYPNPAHTQITIETERMESFNISLSDVHGKELMTVENNDSNIDISNLQSGVYFLKLHFKDHFVIKKITKL